MRHPHARWILRSVPSLLALGLLAFALLGATDPNAPRPVPDALVYPNCTAMLQSSTFDGHVTMPFGSAALQPIGAFGNVAACSLSVYSYTSGSSAQMAVVGWNPATLAPDPTTVALRTTSLNASAISYGWTKLTCSPPLVLKSLATVADPPPAHVAIRYDVSSYSFSTQMLNTIADAPANVPTGWIFTPTRTALPGARGAFAHAVCGGDALLQSLAVAQGVSRCDGLFPSTTGAIAQRFRVSVPTQLYWVELAFGVPTVQSGQYGSLSILDAQGAAEPPTDLTHAIVTGVFPSGQLVPQWASHYDFDRSITLLPDHDYWLWVAINAHFLLYGRTLDGSEAASFAGRVGECWTRPAGGTAFTLDLAHALDFKIVGYPIGVLEAPPATPVASAFTLRASPNPARGAVTLAWSGARGALAFEVLDARGRRVARGDASASSQGTWRFDGLREDGRPLPAGVYFVRARDGDGRLASERVVLLR